MYGCGVRDRSVCRGCVQCVCVCARVGGVCARAECVSGSVGVRAACVISVCVCVCAMCPLGVCSACARLQGVRVRGRRAWACGARAG